MATVPGKIRPARDEDLPLIAEIERAAGMLFAEAGMPDIAEHAPTPLHVLREHLEDNTLLIATDRDEVVGFASLIVFPDHAHLDQMAVHPAYGRRGHGTRLIEEACALARERAYTSITLTTFEHIAWNAPFYAQRGFRILAQAELTDELHALRAQEATYGLNPSLRVVMRRDISAHAPRVTGPDGDSR